MTGEDTLRQRVEELAIEVGGSVVTSARDGDATIWSVGGRPFASLTDAAVELRLDPAIAHAATRTPDTSPSERGPEWVRFAPRDLDDRAIDRLEAWFAFARRRASESARST